jgi:hypothetical protein
MTGNNDIESSKNIYEGIENMEVETINSKESTEQIQIQHDLDPVPPSKKNDSVFIHLKDPSPILTPPIPDLEDER